MAGDLLAPDQPHADPVRITWQCAHCDPRKIGVPRLCRCSPVARLWLDEKENIRPRFIMGLASVPNMGVQGRPGLPEVQLQRYLWA